MKIANQMMKGFSLLALVACLSISASAQKAYVLPSPTDANAELTLYIDMNQSEDGLQNNGLSAILDAFPDTSVYLWTWDPAGPAAGNGDWDNSAGSSGIDERGVHTVRHDVCADRVLRR